MCVCERECVVMALFGRARGLDSYLKRLKVLYIAYYEFTVCV